MKTLKKVTKTQYEAASVICNKCGEEDNRTYHSFNVGGEYHSKYLGDMIDYEFDLCEKCLWEVIRSLKHPPLTIDNMTGVCLYPNKVLEEDDNA